MVVVRRVHEGRRPRARPLGAVRAHRLDEPARGGTDEDPPVLNLGIKVKDLSPNTGPWPIMVPCAGRQLFVSQLALSKNCEGKAKESRLGPWVAQDVAKWEAGKELELLEYDGSTLRRVR